MTELTTEHQSTPMKPDNEVRHDAREILTSARAFIERGWTQGALARNRQGMRCSAIMERDEACAWCAVGALDAGAYELFGRVDHAGIPLAALTLKEVIFPEKPANHYLSDFNDAPERKKEEVISVYDKAIERLKEDPSP